MKELKYRIIGETPLIVHNGQLANPLNPITRQIKKISSKRNKTDADFEEMAHLEFLGSLYLEDQKPIIPGEMFKATIRNGAKKRKQGQDFIRSVRCPGNFPIEFNGNTRTPEELWKDKNHRFESMVTIQRNKVLRTRPIFKEWKIEAIILYDETVLEEADIEAALTEAGEKGFLGDWRGEYGHFSFKKI